MKIAASSGTEFAFLADYKVMAIDLTDFTNVCAVVVTCADLPEVWAELERLGFDIPIFAAVKQWRRNGCLNCMA